MKRTIKIILNNLYFEFFKINNHKKYFQSQEKISKNNIKTKLNILKNIIAYLFSIKFLSIQ